MSITFKAQGTLSVHSCHRELVRELCNHAFFTPDSLQFPAWESEMEDLLYDERKGAFVDSFPESVVEAFIKEALEQSQDLNFEEAYELRSWLDAPTSELSTAILRKIAKSPSTLRQVLLEVAAPYVVAAIMAHRGLSTMSSAATWIIADHGINWWWMQQQLNPSEVNSYYVDTWGPYIDDLDENYGVFYAGEALGQLSELGYI